MYSLSKLSEIYASYKKNLDRAQDEYEESVRKSAANTCEFYQDFFGRLIVNLGEKFETPGYRRDIISETERFFGKRKLNFVSIDGSCHKHSSNDYVSFYGAAYGAKGTLTLSESDAMVEYKRWEIEKDVSMVAFVPIPYSRLTEIEGTEKKHSFATSESDRIELTSMHLPIMQLAEVFLAYNSATSSNLDSPDIILMDNSISGMLGYTEFSPDNVRLVGCVLADGHRLEKHDAAVAQSHPFGAEMGVPSTKIFSRRFAVIQFLHDNHATINNVLHIGDICESTGITDKKTMTKILKRLERDGIVRLGHTPANTAELVIDPYKSWEQTKSLFQSMCKAIFLDKRDDALKYNVINSEDTNNNSTTHTTRWMSPDDIRFLIAVGLRALIEVCWERKILLVGIIKDSASTYLTNHYLGVCRHFGKYPQLYEKSFGLLPPTDRTFCELLPYIDDKLHAPWGTIEFDSTFMTLRMDIIDGKEIIGGTFGGITRPERLFMRSIAQFYTRRHTESPLTGHAIFIDRLTFPQWDAKSERVRVVDPKLGTVDALFYPDNTVTNIGQQVTYFLLDNLTKNHFAEMIGYPDPLHKADQGAKSMRDTVKGLLESSDIKFRARPLINTLREIRSSFAR